MKTYTLKTSKAQLAALTNNIIAVNGGSTPHPSTQKLLKDLSKNQSLLSKQEILKEVILNHLVILN